MNPDEELSSLKRGLRVLAVLNEIGMVGVSELARRLELPRTTTERILLTLVAEGYVQRVPYDRRYRLSAKVWSLSRGFSDQDWIVQAATPLLFQTTRQIGWPLALATRSGDQMVLRVTTDGATSLSLHPRKVGAKTPLLGSSSGLVALAFVDEREREALVSSIPPSAFAVNRQHASDADADAVTALAMAVRADGFAFQPPPNDRPERSIAIPVIVDGRFQAALLMMYMARALADQIVIGVYLPMLRDLAAAVVARAARRDDPESLAEPEFKVPAAVMGFGP